MRDLEHWNDHKDVQHKLIIEEWNSWLGSLRDSPDVHLGYLYEYKLVRLVDLQHLGRNQYRPVLFPSLHAVLTHKHLLLLVLLMLLC